MDRFVYTEPKRLPHGWECAHPDCWFESLDRDDLKKCLSCGREFCPECVREIGDEWFCEDCAKCEKVHCNHGKAEKCGDPAVFACENCGNLLCAGDTRGYSSYDSETGYAEVGYVCRGGCAVNPTEAMALEVTA